MLGLTSLINLVDSNLLPQSIVSKVPDILKECILLAEIYVEKLNEDDDMSDDENENEDLEDDMTPEESINNKNVIRNLVEDSNEDEESDDED